MVSSKTVHATREDVEDAEKIGCKLFFGRVRNVIENQEFSTVLFDHPLEQFESKTAQTVSMGDDKRELISAQKGFQ